MPNDPFDYYGNRDVVGGDSYTGVRQDHEYKTDSGLLPLPLACATPKMRLFRLHGGIGTRTVRWETGRSGKPPIIPAAVSVGTDVLVGATVVPRMPTANPTGGGYNWTVSGEYTFAQTALRTAGADPLPTGGYPFPVPGVDGLANALMTPAVGSALVSGGLPAAVAVLEQGVDHITDAYLWPFTVIGPVFTAPDLIQA